MAYKSRQVQRILFKRLLIGKGDCGTKKESRKQKFTR
jgi:hypothetical protein